MIRGYVVGDAAVIQRFSSMPNKLRTNIRTAITRLVIKLQRNVKANKLSGQVLNVRTGTLRRSIDFKVSETGTGIAGKVSTNVKYARPHEYGFQGVVTVQAHLRQIKEAFGKSITPTTVAVGAHTRQVNLPERSFLRSALRDMEQSGEITRELAEAVRKSTV